MCEHFVLNGLVVELRSCAAQQLLHALRSRTTGGLIRRHDQLLDAEVHVNRPERHCSNSCRAVWVGDELILSDSTCVNLGDLNVVSESIMNTWS
jgi:hypothetical protein